MTQTQIERAYIAGLLDGEATLRWKTYKKGRNKPYIMMTLTMMISEKNIRDYVASTVHKMGLSCSCYQYQPKKPPTAKLQYGININGKNAKVFYEVLKPYLKRLSIIEYPKPNFG